jgi:hypothetical protein
MKWGENDKYETVKERKREERKERGTLNVELFMIICGRLVLRGGKL